MNRKQSTLSNLRGITEEQADQLFEMLRILPYHLAVKHVREQWDIAVSVSGLQRWRAKESQRRMRLDLRNAIKASERFDTALDSKQLDARANNALRAALWGALTNRDTESISTLGKLVLDYNADARDTEKLQRALKAERDLETAREENAALTARIAALEVSLTEAGKTTAADPAAVSAALDKHLGVSK